MSNASASRRARSRAPDSSSGLKSFVRRARAFRGYDGAVMRAMLLAACAASAACGFDAPSVPDGGGDAPADDRDGDGVGDTADVCPEVSDPQQRDHDGDGRGDACDRCPHLSNTADPDQDGDGVGDACDPAPSVAADRRALWIGFYPEDAQRIGDNSEWRPYRGNWSITDGWVRGAINGVGGLHAEMGGQRAAIASRIRLDDVTDGDATVGVISGLVFGSQSIRQLYQCAISRDQTRIGARSIINGVQTDSYTPWTGTIAAGVIVEVSARFASNMFECNFAAPSTTARSSSAMTGGFIELVVRDATVSYDYVFIVEQGS